LGEDDRVFAEIRKKDLPGLHDGEQSRGRERKRVSDETQSTVISPSFEGEDRA
jgi:hypothetical protein